jgi:hypothetical protein
VYPYRPEPEDMTVNRSVRTVAFVFCIAWALSGCVHISALLEPSPHESSGQAAVASAPALEPAPVSRPAVSKNSARTVKTSKISNDPERTVDASVYRKNVPLPSAAEIAKRVKPASIRTDAELTSLVRELTDGIEDPFLKVKAVHDWIALTIAYDAASFLKNVIPDQSPFAVLARGSAVCDGYAVLFERMCVPLGVEVRKISGYGRGYGSGALSEENTDRNNHAWNLVKLSGSWYPIDVTWDAGCLDGGTFKREYSTAYFLLRPEQMIFTHFPSDNRYQLLPAVLSRAEFVRLPFLNGDFFDTVASGYERLEKTIRIDSPAELTFRVNAGRVLSCVLYSAATGERADYAWVQTRDGVATLMLSPPEGEYLLRLFSRETGESTGSDIGEFAVRSTLRTPVKAPVLYRDFYMYGVFIVSPGREPVRKGAEVTVSAYIPGVSGARARVDGKLIEMQHKGNDLYSVTLKAPGSGNIDVFIRKNQSESSLSGVFAIQVE